MDLDQVSHQPREPLPTSTELWRSKHISNMDFDVSNVSPYEEQQYRYELFKLLVSYINNINDFDPNVFKSDTTERTNAEERMNSLLYQFWTNDAEVLRAENGLRYPALEAAFTQWMDIRFSLAGFQRFTGYLGPPGVKWEEHLRAMKGVERARASIAFVELKSVGVGGVEDGFSDELAVVFHALTRVEGCNGVEAFEGLGVRNEGMLEWFS